MQSFSRYMNYGVGLWVACPVDPNDRHNLMLADMSNADAKKLTKHAPTGRMKHWPCLNLDERVYKVYGEVDRLQGASI